MSAVATFAVAVLVYPGLLGAIAAAWALGWVRVAARDLTSRQPPANPLRSLADLRVLAMREATVSDGSPAWVVPACAGMMVLCPALALVLLPLPGNPLVGALGLGGDLAAEAGLLLGLPVARMLLGWLTPAVAAGVAGDRFARLLAGAVLPLGLALAAHAQVLGVTRAIAAPVAGVSGFTALALGLAALAVALVLPALARVTPLRVEEGELALGAGALDALSGRDLALARLGEAMQLVAVIAFFVGVLLQPLFGLAPAGGVRVVLWIGGGVLTAVGLGVYEGVRGAPGAREHSPLAWWSGWALLCSLAALVAAAWATRGV